MHLQHLVVFGVVEALSVACAMHLWRRRDPRVARRVWWTLITLTPILGPLFYGSAYKPLPKHSYREEWEKHSSPYDHAVGQDNAPD